MRFSCITLLIYFYCFSSNADINIDSQIPLSLKCLWSSYKNFKITADRRNIVFPSGVELPYKNRDPEGTPINRLKLTSIDQMFLSPYPQGKIFPVPLKKDQLRSSLFMPFFKQIYGNSPQTVERDLVSLKWVDGRWIVFNRSYGAAHALQQVVQKLQILLKTHPEYIKFLKHPGGTYDWRYISHERNLSMHAFGVAIDINVSYSDYWRWEIGPDGVPHYRNRIPTDIALIFEKNGFVWGGKWYHYDTMHFEYRPELLMSANDCERQFADYRD